MLLMTLYPAHQVHPEALRGRGVRLRDVVRTLVAGQSQGLDQTFQPIDSLLAADARDASEFDLTAHTEFAHLVGVDVCENLSPESNS